MTYNQIVILCLFENTHGIERKIIITEDSYTNNKIFLLLLYNYIDTCVYKL